MDHLLDAYVGLVTPKIANMSVFRPIMSKQHLQNKLIFPTFYAPGFLASLEATTMEALCSQDEKLEVQDPIYLRGEKGWYGNPNNIIVGSPKQLSTIAGCTWDPKLDYWNTMPLDLHESLDTKQCIDIWAMGRNLVFKKSPLTVIKYNKGQDQIKNFTGNLTLGQVKELEKEIGVNLASTWFSNRYQQAEVFGKRFICKNNRYYVEYGTQQVEYTNFSVKLTKIKKENGEFHQHGFIYFNQTETPFSIKRKVFLSFYDLLNELTNTMLEAGVGVPTVAPNLKHYLVNVVESFNPDNTVEAPDPSQLPVSEPRT